MRDKHSLIMSKNKLLTPLELKVMNILWRIERGFVKDILANWDGDDEDKPKYQTVSTIVRILESPKKKFIGHKAYGRTHEYFPIISKEQYQVMFLKNAVKNVFAGSKSTLLSALVDDEDISNTELDVLKRLIDEKG